MISPEPIARARSRSRFAVAAILVVVLGVPAIVNAQGLVQGVQKGAREGNKAAGPIGGVLGGAIGGVVGVVGGVLGGGKNATTAPANDKGGAAKKDAKETKEAKKEVKGSVVKFDSAKKCLKLKVGDEEKEFSFGDEVLYFNAAGGKNISEDLKKGLNVGRRSYKVHLDGYDLGPALRGEGAWPRREFIYWTDDGSVAALRYDNWKITFLKQEAEGLKVWQQPFTVLFTQAVGTSVLHETIFEDRLGYTRYLSKMGANITLFAKCLGEVPCRFRGRNHIHSAVIQGPTPLTAGEFELPTDIRAGMCLVVAGLVASGTTRLSNIHELERKYDHLIPKLCALGADVRVGSK